MAITSFEQRALSLPGLLIHECGLILRIVVVGHYQIRDPHYMGPCGKSGMTAKWSNAAPHAYSGPMPRFLG